MAQCVRIFWIVSLLLAAVTPIAAQSTADEFAGHLDQCTYREISGWAMRNKKAAGITIYVNGKTVAPFVRTDSYRPDVSEYNGGDKYSGFSYSFSTPLLSSDVVEVKFAGTDQVVAGVNWPPCIPVERVSRAFVVDIMLFALIGLIGLAAVSMPGRIGVPDRVRPPATWLCATLLGGVFFLIIFENRTFNVKAAIFSAAIVAAIVVARALWMPRRDIAESPISHSLTGRDFLFATLVALSTAAGTFFFSGSDFQTIRSFMHHYESFLFYREALQSGFVPYYHFPVQYGFGPMVASGLFATSHVSFYIAVCCFNGLHAGVLFLVASSGLRRGLPAHIATALSLVLAMTLMLVDGHGVVVGFFPSVGGIRYLPVAITCLIAIRFREKGPRWLWLSVALSAAWSFEAGLISLIGSGFHCVYRQSIRNCFGCIVAAAVGFAVPPALVAIYYRELDVRSLFDFIGQGTPHNFADRSLAITAFLVCLALVPLLVSRAERGRLAVFGFASALMIYPVMRGQSIVLIYLARLSPSGYSGWRDLLDASPRA
jgi:hypothetical protein